MASPNEAEQAENTKHLFLDLHNLPNFNILRKKDLMISSCTSVDWRTSGGVAMATESSGPHWSRDDEPPSPLAGPKSGVDDAGVIKF